MLPPGDRPRALPVYLLPHVLREFLPDVRARREREQRHGRDRVRVRGDELALALVPRREELRGGRGADETRVRDAGEAHAGDVAGRGVDA